MAGLLANSGNPLGKLRGVFFTNGENRNDYPCDDNSARNAEKEEMMQEKLITGGCPGRLDHTNHNPDSNPNDETLVKEAAVMMKYFPRKNGRGQFIGECLILDNPDGQRLYAYCKSGKKPGVSYRGGIDQEAYENGDIEGAWREFTVEGFDIVVVPAYRECYLDLVEDYLDPENSKEPLSASKKKASIDAKGAARAMLRVAAGKEGAREMVKVMAQDKHFTEEEAVAINKAIDDANVDGNRRTKEQAKEIGTPYDASPQHTWPRQEGNPTLDMHDETAIYGEDDIDPLTGKKIDTLNTGNMKEKDQHVLGLQTERQKAEASAKRVKAGNNDYIEKISILKSKFADKVIDEATYWKQYREIDQQYGIEHPEESYRPVFKCAEASMEGAKKKIDDLAKDAADTLVAEEIEKKKATAGIEKGTVADKEKDDDEQLEGYVDEDGKVRKTAGVLGVQSEEETPEEKKKKGELGEDGKVRKSAKSAIKRTKASVLGVSAEEEDVDDEPEVQLLTEDGIVELGSEIVKDESEEENSEDATMEMLVAEITKLTEAVASLEEVVKGKDEEISNRNSELNDLAASYKRLKGTIASAVDKAKASETVLAENAELQERNANLAKVIAQMKCEHKAVLAELTAENDDYKKVIAGYGNETSIRSRAMAVQANALRKQETDNKILAGKNDNLGKLCIGMVADMLGIDEGKLLASRGQVRTSKDLEKVIASLQRPRRNINANYFPVTEGMRNALPSDLEEVCAGVDWNEEENI